MFWRKKYEPVYGDFTTNKLLHNGLYNVHEPVIYEKRGFLNLEEHPLIVGMWYVFILSCLLWWLPLFGPMIAGYIGGRRAGSPAKGVMVAIIPVVVIFLLLFGMDMGFLPFLSGLAAVPSMIMSSIHSLSPHASSYLSGVYNSLGGAVGINGNGFFIVLIFGYIGGMIADINRSEIERASGSPHFYEGLKNIFSGVGFGKMADMVAERVVLGLGSIGYARRNLIERAHSEPEAFSFENLKRLPAASENTLSYPNQRADFSYNQERAFGYEDLQPIRPAPRGDIYHDELISWDSPRRYEEGRRRMSPQEDEWGSNHRDIFEDPMANSRNEQKRNIDFRGRKRPYKRKSDEVIHKPQPRKRTQKPATQEKRDALVYEDSDKPKKEQVNTASPRAFQKHKQPSLVSRALAQDNEIKLRKEKVKDPLVSLIADHEDGAKPKRVSVAQSYDRL